MGKTLRKILPAALLACSVLTVSAQTGQDSYRILDIPTSAHAYGLGGSGIAVVDDDVTLVEQNPALLGPEIDKQFAFSYMRYFGQSNFAAVRYGMPAGDYGAWSAGIRYLNYGSFHGFDETGSSTGFFSAQDIVFGGSYAHDLNDRWRGGINLNMIYSHYEQYTAFAMSVDLGVNYYDPDKDLSFSIVLRNMGGQLKRFDKEYTRVPFDVQLGYMQALGSSPFSLAITARHLTKWKLPYYSHSTNSDEEIQALKSTFFGNFFRHLTFGLQYTYNERFYIALGYDYKTRTDMATYQRNFLSGFSLATGLKVRGFGFGVAYAMPHKGASTLMVNLNCTLGELLR